MREMARHSDPFAQSTFCSANTLSRFRYRAPGTSQSFRAVAWNTCRSILSSRRRSVTLARSSAAWVRLARQAKCCADGVESLQAEQLAFLYAPAREPGRIHRAQALASWTSVCGGAEVDQQGCFVADVDFAGLMSDEEFFRMHLRNPSQQREHPGGESFLDRSAPRRGCVPAAWPAS